MHDNSRTFIGELQVSLFTNPADLVVPLASDRIVVRHLKKKFVYSSDDKGEAIRNSLLPSIKLISLEVFSLAIVSVDAILAS
jgi:hypothetical protein